MTQPNHRVLFLTTGLNRGGAEMQVFHLATGLQSRGWNVKVVAMLSGGSMAGEFQEADITPHELGMRRGVPDPRAILRLRKIIREFHPEIVHSHMVHANLLARLTRLVCPMPALVNTAHSITEGGRWTEIAYRLTDWLSDMTTIICVAGAQRYLQNGSVSKERLRVVVNGLPVESFRPNQACRLATRKRLGIQEEFAWLAVGRLDSPKDYPNLINAVARIPSRRFLFLIAGDGPMRLQIEKLAAERKVLDRVRFLGIRKDIPELMAAADGYVMSSAWEGLPMVLLEAAASGLPIVATNVGGNGEVVRDGLSGFLVPPSDSESLAKALQRMENTPLGARNSMGMVGREYVIRNYSLSLVLDEWESIYHSLIPKSKELSRAQGSC